MYEHLLYELNNGVATITLNRPEVFNAINNKISYELQAALKECAKDPNVRVVVFTGAGEKAFCSGQDLKEIKDSPERSLAESLHKRYNPIIRAMRNLPKPIVGKINGVAAGAGCSLALACDIIVAAETASFTEIFINVGLVLDSGSSYFLPKLVGSARAFELASTGKKVSAQQAFEWGMINAVCPNTDLDAKVAEYANYYAAAPTKAVGLMKKMLNKAGNASLDEMLEYEAYCQEIAGRSADAIEGRTAFVEKRKPVFKGQ